MTGPAVATAVTRPTIVPAKTAGGSARLTGDVCTPLWIALVGPDGVGKSTVIDAVRRWFERNPRSIEVVPRQWRPGLLPALITFTGRPESREKSVRPRRQPGRFQFARLAYYFLDFSVGHWWKDRGRSACPRLVIYDRCALDMTVDPVRFGLSSTRGTRLLWRLVPHPDLTVLLYDSPDRIRARKQELATEEIVEQLDTWCRLAEEGEVNGVIRVDADPETVSARVRDLLEETIGRKLAGRDATKARGEDTLRWIAAVLNGAECEGATIRPTAHGCAAVGRSITAPGAASFAVLPHRSAPRLLIPLGARRTMRSALAAYAPQRTIARVSKRALASALGAGVARPMLSSVSIAPAAGRASLLLSEHLERVFGERDLALSISPGTAGAHRKPVIQVMDRAGRTLGYAKIGWNEATTRLVRQEAAILRKLRNVRFARALVPRIVDAGCCGALYVVVQQSLERSSAKPCHELRDAHVEFLLELHAAFPPQSAHVAFEWPIDRLAALGFHYYGHVVEQARSWCERRISVAALPTAFAHGDFTPWNMRLDESGLVVIDWEYAGDGRTAGWDLFHFLVATAVELKEHSPGEIFRSVMKRGSVRERIERYFAATGPGVGLIGPCFVAYLADALAQNLARDGRSPSRRDAQLRRAWSEVLNLVLHRPEPRDGFAA